MENIMAKLPDELVPGTVQLRCIWNVSADKTYRIVRKKTEIPQKYVALCTLSGSGEITMRSGKAELCSANTIDIFSANQIGHYRTFGDSWRFYWFEFYVNETIEIQQGLRELQVSAREAEDLQNCFALLSSGGALGAMEAQALFCYYLARWQRVFYQPEQRDNILFLLEKGGDQNLDIPRMARQACMSERSFRNAVHAAAGMSPKEYLLHRKMQAAMELLLNTEASVSQIASYLSYKSPLYFSRVFRNYYGFSPSQARGNIQL